MDKIDVNVLTGMIITERRNEYVGYLLGLKSWSNGFTFAEIEDLLLASDLDLLIGTKNIAIIHDKKNDRLYGLPVTRSGIKDDIKDRYNFNRMGYLG